MTMKLTPALLAMALLCPIAAALASESAYQSMPDDPRAIKVRAKGDGKSDDTAAIQAALDQAANKSTLR